jgi:hypothetical protein
VGTGAFFSCFGSVRFFADVPPSPLSDLSRAEPEALLFELFGEVAAPKQTVSEQREAIARLKGPKGRPVIKPSGMDDATEPLKRAKKGKRRFRGKVTPRVKVEDQVVKIGGRKARVSKATSRSGTGSGDISQNHLLPARTLGNARWSHDT